MRRISLTLLLALVFPALAAGAARDTKLALVAYSTPKDAYAQLIPAFQKTAAGKDVSFSQSYGASGDQSRAVAAGLPADIVALSLAPDITSLVQKHLVAQSWNKDKFKGMVTPSVKKVEYGVDFKRVMRGRLVLGIADGWLKADGEPIYAATDLKVGLSKQSAA